MQQFSVKRVAMSAALLRPSMREYDYKKEEPSSKPKLPAKDRHSESKEEGKEEEQTPAHIALTQATR